MHFNETSIKWFFFLFARFIHALDDLDALIAHADEIIENNLQTLNMQMLNDLF
ncbi:MAG: hypothetical protein JJ934_19160 [Pseudomonadales bacterium]|nr:hypothetical protein [Pseudomonadales bacterium]